MSGTSTPADAPSPTARQVADELRSSVAVRRRLLAQDEGEDAGRLHDLGNLEGVPPVARPGPAAPVVRGVRRVLQGFLRPWLAAQTIFNRELVRRFQGTATTVRDLERRAPRFEQAVEHLEARIRELEVARADSGTRVGDRPVSLADVLSVERLFVHSRIPRPPARVMVEGPASAGVVADLTAFGFEVTTVPAAAASVDAVVSLSIPGTDLVPGGAVTMVKAREAWRAIRPGGELIVTVVCDPGTGSSHAWWTSGLRAALAPFVIVETLVAAPDGAGSLVVTPLPPGGDLPSGGRETLVLIHARRPDAPDR